jgi:hypothetical protein
MVYIAMVLVKANEVFAPMQSFEPADLLEMLNGADTLADAAQLLDLESVVPAEWQQAMMDLLENVPPSIDAAAMAAIRKALERGLRVMITWQPAYTYGLHVWDVTKFENDAWVGLVNVHISSRDPEMDSGMSPA